MTTRTLAPLLAVLMAAWCAVPAQAQTREIENRERRQRTTFSDAEIIDGFLKITIGAEFQTGGQSDRIRRFDGPTRIFIDNRARPDRSAQAASVIRSIAEKIPTLDAQLVAERAQANLVVTLVRDRDLSKTIRTVYGEERARRIQRSLDPQCLSGFRKDDAYRIQHAEVILVADAGDLIFYDCAYEEILQALGPINDDESVPWTMFNDDVQLGFFGRYDQHILNLLYHPRMKPGMNRTEARDTARAILPEVRALVARLNPAVERKPAPSKPEGR